MADPRGFLKHAAEPPTLRPVHLRVLDWREVQEGAPDPKILRQSSRCMDCGVPFCSHACPLGNVIPDWNDLVYRGRWEQALTRLLSTNSFPEFTGLVCPAPCEAACVLGMQDEQITIKQIEWEIIRRGFDKGLVVPQPPPTRTGKRVAIVGSGPAGLAAAQQLNRAGHGVTVFEKAEEPGGLLRFGIPDFKLEKPIVARRVHLMECEGVEFRTGVHVGVDIAADDLTATYDAVLLAGGSEKPRDLPVEGRNLRGVHFAIDFLSQQNRRNAGRDVEAVQRIWAKDQRVVVLGGGDTGSDCVGTALRQGARSVTSLELLERPPEARERGNPWPDWPHIFRSSSSHEEGGVRDFGVMTTRFSGNERVQRLHAVRVRMGEADARGQRKLEPISASEFDVPVDIVLLAMGFVHAVHDALLADLGVEIDSRGNIAATPHSFATSVPGVFAAGDMRRGQSLVVWAIWEGREAARAIDAYLTGTPRLASRDCYG
ncbi:MAG: glutamate synthase subunit beta [Polyangiaceae bacterium]|nr:glutamate synthase subunit beta [Polyangiaceae bacterium]